MSHQIDATMTITGSSPGPSSAATGSVEHHDEQMRMRTRMVQQRIWSSSAIDASSSAGCGSGRTTTGATGGVKGVTLSESLLLSCNNSMIGLPEFPHNGETPLERRKEELISILAKQQRAGACSDEAFLSPPLHREKKKVAPQRTGGVVSGGGVDPLTKKKPPADDEANTSSVGTATPATATTTTTTTMDQQRPGGGVTPLANHPHPKVPSFYSFEPLPIDNKKSSSDWTTKELEDLNRLVCDRWSDEDCTATTANGESSTNTSQYHGQVDDVVVNVIKKRKRGKDLSCLLHRRAVELEAKEVELVAKEVELVAKEETVEHRKAAIEGKAWGLMQEIKRQDRSIHTRQRALMEQESESLAHQINVEAMQKRFWTQRQESAKPDDDCFICYEKPIDCILVPCGHMVACMECAEKLDGICCICKQESEPQKIYRTLA
jgi:Zinc finger, C3HC4 type (RING finger)